MARIATEECEEGGFGMCALLRTEWDSLGHLEHLSTSSVARASSALSHLK